MAEILEFSLVVTALIWLCLRRRTRMIISVIGYQQWYRHHYIWSPSWRFSRWLKLAISGRKCRQCGTRYRIDVHHLSYKLFGLSILYWEWLLPFRLRVLCRSCHDLEHG